MLCLYPCMHGVVYSAYYKLDIVYWVYFKAGHKLFCAVINCGNRTGRSKGKRLFRLPTVISSQGDKSLELSSKRQREWLASIKRKDVRPDQFPNIIIAPSLLSSTIIIMPMDQQWLDTNISMQFKLTTNVLQKQKNSSTPPLLLLNSPTGLQPYVHHNQAKEAHLRKRRDSNA